MFVWFRDNGYRLQLSLIETRRAGGSVRNEHIASLGSIPRPATIADRVAFWAALHRRLGQLVNRVDDETRYEVLAAVHARIPMVTPQEQRQLQRENAKADADHWSGIESLHASTAAGHKKAIATAQAAVVESEAEAAKAAANVSAAKHRIDRLDRGEDVPGGLMPSPSPFSDEALLAAGLTRRLLRRMRLVASVGDLGEEVFEVFLAASIRAANVVAASDREARACLKLFGNIDDPVERAEAAREMLAAMKGHNRD